MRTSLMPAFRTCSAAQLMVFELDGKPVTRPHSWPVPISWLVRLSFENDTMMSRSARMVAPSSSGDLTSPAGTIAGRTPRGPTRTAGTPPSFGGSGTPNQGAGADAALRVRGAVWATQREAAPARTAAANTIGLAGATRAVVSGLIDDPFCSPRITHLPALRPGGA